MHFRIILPFTLCLFQVFRGIFCLHFLFLSWVMYVPSVPPSFHLTNLTTFSEKLIAVTSPSIFFYHSRLLACHTLKICKYKVVQIWPGLFVCKQVTVCPGHFWTTLYIYIKCHCENHCTVSRLVRRIFAPRKCPRKLTLLLDPKK
jgi:hypothetical protein